MDKISATKTCKPVELASKLNADELERFSQAIYHVVEEAIPEGNKELQGALEAHSLARDGYALMDCLADTSVQYMHDINVG